MKKLLFIILSAFMICGCQDEEDKWPEGSYEYYANHLCGNYVLSKVFWSGTPVDLNTDGFAYNDLLENELTRLLGFHEPYSYACIQTVKNDKAALYKRFMVNLQLPYPEFYMNGNTLKYSRLSYLPLTIYEKYSSNQLSSETIYLKNYNGNSLFLSGCDEIMITRITPDEFIVRLHCYMYHTYDSSPDLNYLYYTYRRIS